MGNTDSKPATPRRGCTRAVLVVSTVWLVISGRAIAEDAPAGNALFGTDRVVRLHLQLSPAQFDGLLPAPGPGAAPDGSAPEGRPAESHRNTFGVELPWSRGDLTWEGETYRDVGVRLKGNYTFVATARSLERSLKIDPNRFKKGQKIDGESMLNLHCGVSDPSGAREALSYAFFRDAGVTAPRTALAELTLTVPGRYTDEFVGVHTLVEQVDKAFLARHFGDGGGMLLKPEGLMGGPNYLGEAWEPYADRYRPERIPTARQKQRLIDFAKLVSEGSDEAFAAGIGDHLDVDAFLRFIAANALLANLDSYLGFGHNYYLYLVPATDRFVFIPWDLDLSLASWPAAGSPEQLVQLSIDHPHAGRDTLLDRLLAIPDHRKRYRAIIDGMLATSFTRPRLQAELDSIEAALREPLALEAYSMVLRKEARSGQFGHSMPPRRFIEERLASVAAQLAGESTGFVPRRVGFGGQQNR